MSIRFKVRIHKRFCFLKILYFGVVELSGVGKRAGELILEGHIQSADALGVGCSTKLKALIQGIRPERTEAAIVMASAALEEDGGSKGFQVKKSICRKEKLP